jgi:predicted RNA-binding Zn-ribbon protein involved in translation (DUF1610 family)
MYFKTTAIPSEYIRTSSLGKIFKTKKDKISHHYRCNNCGTEFVRSTKPRTKNDIHFCSKCPRYSLMGRETIKVQHKKAEIRGRKFDRGYPEIWVGCEYPYRPASWVREHIVVMEQHIQQKIPKGKVVHHIDGSKTNNNLDNLLLCSIAEHNQCHAKIERLVFELYNKGLVKFDKDTLEYYYTGTD